ncbi:PucR family transcriptional regulator [Streptomyces ureilyticus]|uniref:PucR family transcriptional regulator n=1 Tax=Streptomyces ureilyticus TaxID=1775131 RepID=A0ABX0E2Z0_9ACTN|nr:helix-turn-helix domain-containing protein [Streptomyces ureilyticus]NGO45661.1 PucR family transcriptional regulator [Streptomyces ureilyticus]
MQWLGKLSATRSEGHDLEWLGPDAERIRKAWGPGAVLWAAEVGERVIEKAGQELPLLGGSGSIVDALRRATMSTTLRVLAIVSGCAEPEASVVSAEAEEATRDMARRGLKLHEFTRSIRFGHAVLTTAFFDAISAASPPHHDDGELRRVTLQLFPLIDEFIAAMSAVFLDEQSAWSASRSAAQLELVRKVVEGTPVDHTAAERLLDYPLTGTHLAVIAWRMSPGEGTAHGLREAIDPVLRCWGTPEASLVVPVGSNTLWAWGAFETKAHLTPGVVLPEFDDVKVVVGQVGSGVEGFRRSHREARAVERLLRRGSDRQRASLAHQDVDLDVLLLEDREAAHQFADRHLGPLSADDPRMAELRSTLRRYLDTNHSLAKVATMEQISRNTVTYRVQQAFTLCGHSGDAPTDKLRAALTVAEWLLHSPHTGQ